MKKTTELTAEEKQGILSLFNHVFEKERTLKELDNQYLNNPLGYSFHSLMKHEGLVVGHNSGIPSYYLIRGERKLFVCNVDTMIRKEFRGIDNFYDLIANASQRYQEEGAVMLYGFPNDNSYPLLTSLGLMKDIGKLDTYCLPYRIGGVKPALRWFNLFSKWFCNCWVAACRLYSSKKIVHFDVEKEEDSYNLTRYQRSDGQYAHVKLDDFCFVYKIICHEGIRTAFLIDVMGKSAEHFRKAVKHIVKVDGSRFDLLLYVGRLPFSGHGMIKIPHKFEPKHFYFTGMVLNDTHKKDVLINADAWDVNLSNYDLI